MNKLLILLLLMPMVSFGKGFDFQKAFDKGYISFEDNGDLTISELLNPDLLKAWKIDLQMNVGKFHEKQKEYLEYHRKYILKKDGKFKKK